MNDQLTLKNLICIVAADIDIFLLKTENQQEDLEKDFFTKTEIRQQLDQTIKKVINVLQNNGYNINTPIPREFNLSSLL